MRSFKEQLRDRVIEFLFTLFNIKELANKEHTYIQFNAMQDYLQDTDKVMQDIEIAKLQKYVEKYFDNDNLPKRNGQGRFISQEEAKWRHNNDNNATNKGNDKELGRDKEEIQQIIRAKNAESPKITQEGHCKHTGDKCIERCPVTNCDNPSGEELYTLQQIQTQQTIADYVEKSVNKGAIIKQQLRDQINAEKEAKKLKKFAKPTPQEDPMDKTLIDALDEAKELFKQM